jgi:hypothetical protein
MLDSSVRHMYELPSSDYGVIDSSFDSNTDERERCRKNNIRAFHSKFEVQENSRERRQYAS